MASSGDHLAGEPDWVGSRLLDYLRHIRPDAPGVMISGLSRSGGGSSRENWAFDVEWNVADCPPEQLILRRDPPGSGIQSDRTVEFRLLRALQETTLATPGARWIETGGAWLDQPFMIMDRHRGAADRRVLTSRSTLNLPEGERVELARQLCEFLAELHTVDVDALGLREGADAIPETTPAEILATLTERINEDALEPQPELHLALSWLRAHLPALSRPALVHGDFRPGNALVGPGGGLEAVLDWEFAHIGDPLEDIGWYLAPIYLREHFVPGRWEPNDFLGSYSTQTGLPIRDESVRFWTVVAMVRLASLSLQSIHAFAEDESERVSSPTPHVYRHLVSALGQAMGDR